MRSSTALLVLFAHLFALSAAHVDWWLPSLPRCWQSCFAKTEEGCSSTTCICSTSEDSASYLPSAVACAVSKCNADEWALDLVLGPLDLLCFGMKCPIPKDVMNDAYAAAADDGLLQSTPTPASATSSKQVVHNTSKGSNDAQPLTSTLSSTITKTTTDSSGNTLQVVIPIVVGPSGISTGAISTSTLSGRATSTGAPSSARPNPSAEASLPALTFLPSSTSAAGARQTKSPAGGNGSPFDTPAAASRWAVSGPVLGLAALAIVLMRF